MYLKKQNYSYQSLVGLDDFEMSDHEILNWKMYIYYYFLEPFFLGRLFMQKLSQKLEWPKYVSP